MRILGVGDKVAHNSRRYDKHTETGKEAKPLRVTLYVRAQPLLFVCLLNPHYHEIDSKS